MLPRSRRLNRRDIADVVSAGRSFHGPHLSVRVLYTPEQGRAGAAAVVPKRILKGAVQRNRLRRRLAAAIAHLLPQGPRNTLVVVFAKQGAAEQETSALTEELKTLFSKAGIEQA